MSSQEHGDARRAIDLLRTAGEIAGKRGEKIRKMHIDAAVARLQKDRVSTTLSSASYHLKLSGWSTCKDFVFNTRSMAFYFHCV